MKNSERIERSILAALEERGAEKSVCPSEIARALWPEDWREHMDQVRAVAAQLAEQGRLQVTQKGKPIDLATVKGPIRLRQPPPAKGRD